MINRKHLILTGAVMAAVPLVSRAATVAFSYDQVQYSTVAGFTAGNVTTVSVVGNAVTIPAGDFFRFGVSATVTNNPNSEANGAYVQGGGTAQPAILGVGGFGMTVTDSNGNVITPRATTGNSVAVINTLFDVKGKGDVTGTTVGGNFSLSGGVLAGNVDTTSSSATPKLAIGGGAAADLFTSLIYNPVGNGSAVLTPAIPTFAFIVNDQASTSTAPPSYTTRNANAGDSVGLLPALTVNVGTGGGGSKIISLLATSAGGVTSTAFTGTSNPGAPGTAGVNVVGSNGGFVRGELNAITGTGRTGQTEVKFQNPLGGATVDPGTEYIGLNIHDTAGAQGSSQFNTDIAALITDLNGSTLGLGATDAFLPTDPAVLLAAQGLNAGKSGEGAYDVILKIPTSAAVGLGDSFLGLDFTAGGTPPAELASLSVTDIAAVPEPATAAGLLIGASGLLLGRRKRKA